MKIHIIGNTDLPAVAQTINAVIKNGFELSARENCDIAIAPYLTYKLNGELKLPKIGTLIFHPSLLPTRRGGEAIKSSYAHGDNITGVTWFWADENFDAGDICSQEAFHLDRSVMPRDHYNEKVLPAMARTLETALSEFKLGYFRRVKQVKENATFDKKIVREKITV